MALAEAGAVVTVAARSADGLSVTQEAIARHDREAKSMILDVTDCEAVTTQIRNSGPFDILVNAAGMVRHAPAADVTPSDFDRVMAVNVRGAFFVAQAVAQGLIADGRPGTLINISSQMGHVGGIDRSVYCASKHEVEGFTKSMAIEWGPHGSRVNT